MSTNHNVKKRADRRQPWMLDLLFVVGITLLGFVLLGLWWSR